MNHAIPATTKATAPVSKALSILGPLAVVRLTSLSDQLTPNPRGQWTADLARSAAWRRDCYDALCQSTLPAASVEALRWFPTLVRRSRRWFDACRIRAGLSRKASNARPVDRKSVQPMAARLAPGEYDQLHHFIADGLWMQRHPRSGRRLVGCRAGHR
jgi:hypothetical protein